MPLVAVGHLFGMGIQMTQALHLETAVRRIRARCSFGLHGIAIFLLALGILFTPLGAKAQKYGAKTNPELERFIGIYSGTADVERENGATETRNMHVEIRAAGAGFWVKWTTRRTKPSGKVSDKSYDILFEPGGRGDLYSAAMRQNVFGHAVPLDPLKGEPYVWARLSGDTLTVFSLFINPNGDYEMQQYDRTLVDGGLDLHFSAHRNGFPRLEAKSFLERQP